MTFTLKIGYCDLKSARIILLLWHYYYLLLTLMTPFSIAITGPILSGGVIFVGGDAEAVMGAKRL